MDIKKIKEKFENIKKNKYKFNFNSPNLFLIDIEEMNKDIVIFAKTFIICKSKLKLSGKKDLIKFSDELNDFDCLSYHIENYHNGYITSGKYKNLIEEIVREYRDFMEDFIFFVYNNSNACEEDDEEEDED